MKRSAARLMLMACIAVAHAPAAIALGAPPDPVVDAVVDASRVAGPPGQRDAAPMFGEPPSPVPPIPDPPTAERIAVVNESIEAWTAWAWRAGALSAVHGVVGPDTLEAVEMATRQILAGCARSMAATDVVVERLDAGGDAVDDALVAKLVVARRVSTPLRAARAALWAGACRDPDDPGVTELLRSAAMIAAAVDASAPSAALDRAAVIGQAAIALGEVDEALRALTEANRAARELTTAGAPGTRIELHLVRARIESARSEAARASTALDLMVAEATADDGTIDFATAALAAGARARLTLDEGLPARSPAVRAHAAATAAGFLGALIDMQGTSEPSAARRRASAYEALRGIGERIAPADPWPGLVVAASAERSIGHTDTDAPALIEWLDAWVGSGTAATDPDADQVRLQLARVLATTGNKAGSGRAALLAGAFAQAHPGDDRAGAAISLACAAALRSMQWPAQERVKLVSILRMADEARFDVPGRDKWRVALVGVLADDSMGMNADGVRSMFEDQLAIAQRITEPEQARKAAESIVSMAMFHGLGVPKAWNPDGDDLDADTFAPMAAAVADHAEAVGLGAHADLLRAESCIAMGRYGEAIRLAEARVESERRLYALGILARASALSGDANQTRRVFTGIRSTTPALVEPTAIWIGDAAWKALESRADALPEDVVGDAEISRLATALTVAVEAHTDPAELNRKAGIALVLAGRNAEAKPLLIAACEADPADTDASVALAESLIGTGDDAGAFARLREIATQREQARLYDRSYFRAWARMLEVLDRQNADGSRSDAIGREAYRLMQAPSLNDQADVRRLIEGIARKYPPAQR